MSAHWARAGLSGLAVAFVSFNESSAHEIVGNRFFPATIGIDDPGVNGELSLPTVDSFKTGDVPPVRQCDISGEFSKRITEDFAISFGSTYTFLGPIDPTTAGANGFQNLDTTFKYRVFKSPSTSSFFRSASASNGAGRGRRASAPSRSTPTCRTSISAKGSAIFPPRSLGSGRRRSPARSATRFRGKIRPRPPASIRTPAI
jgi:hypothetical protein